MSMRSRSAVLRWLLVGIPCYGSWLLANVGLLVLYPLLLPIEYLGGGGGRRILRRFCVLFFRLFFLHHLPFLGMYRVERSDDIQKLRDTGACVVVANHTSWLDALILFALVPGIRPLVSVRYGRIPVASRAMGWLGCIFVDRRSRESAIAAAEEMGRALAEGAPVAVFPEGRRGSIGALRPFQEAFFRIAVEARVPVLPVLLMLTRPFLGPGAENFLTEKGAVLKIRVLGEILPESGEKAGDLAFRTRRAMKQVVQGHYPYPEEGE